MQKYYMLLQVCGEIAIMFPVFNANHAKTFAKKAKRTRFVAYSEICVIGGQKNMCERVRFFDVVFIDGESVNIHINFVRNMEC